MSVSGSDCTLNYDGDMMCLTGSLKRDLSAMKKNKKYIFVNLMSINCWFGEKMYSECQPAAD